MGQKSKLIYLFKKAMKKKIKVLMVDDHPIIVEGYKNILASGIDDQIDLFIDSANSCKDAYEKVLDSKNVHPFDIIFLDISLPPAEDLKIYSGEDLGLKIKTISPNSKIVIMTMHNDNMRIHNLMKYLNPEGLLIKSDVTPREFIEAFEKVEAGKIYYSQTVNEMLRKHFTNDILLDEVDRKILFHISKGIKTKDLSEVVNLSLAAIEKRKRTIREGFDIEQGGDLVLIDRAKELGFL